jgi:hypothetical protein
MCKGIHKKITKSLPRERGGGQIATESLVMKQGCGLFGQPGRQAGAAVLDKPVSIP